MTTMTRLSATLLLTSAFAWACGGNGGTVLTDVPCGEGHCLDVQQDFDPGQDEDTPPQDYGFDISDDDTFDASPDIDACLGVGCPGKFGCECNVNGDCESGWCVITDAAQGIRRCTQVCFEDCPCDWGCQNVGMVGTDPLFLCMPVVETLCNPIGCLKDGDCGVDNLCVLMETQQFCLQACGSGLEECPAGYECAETANWDESEMSEQCIPLSGHCLCAPDMDYLADVDHCGSCENKCVFDHGYADCQDGLCKLTGCEEGWINLNGIPDDGCEYKCSFKGPDDAPDPLYEDDNCDGIDGNISEAVFVDGATGDDDNLLGDILHPFKTINAALEFADGHDPKKEVYVSKGQYAEQILLLNGVSLYGGYDAAQAWKRSIEDHKAMVLWDGQEPQAVRSVLAINIVDTTCFDGFWLKTSSAVQSSASSYGVYVFHSSAGLVISNNHLEAGNGADGKGGSYGQNSANGNDGGNGSGSFEYGGNSIFPPCAGCNGSDLNANNKPGQGGNSMCGMSGAAGGKGGPSESSGTAGSSATSGGSGGLAGSKTHKGGSGGNGKDGQAGTNGAGGGATGSLNPAGGWVPESGGDGLDGEHGTGGGGGGGGGGDGNSWPFSCCLTAGGAGGGGGGGGCGGSGGKGGAGGGSSFAIFVVEASPTITRNHIFSGSGGNGGVGGQGGDAGSGGDGGIGGSESDDNAGGGGNGGDAGNGGSGGNGGGGAGGSTFGIYILGASSNPACSENQFQINGFTGSGGPGGGGSANKGANGLSGTIFGATPSCASQ